MSTNPTAVPARHKTRQKARKAQKPAPSLPVPAPKPDKPARVLTGPDSMTRAWQQAVIGAMSKDEMKPEPTKTTYDQHRQSLIIEYKPSAPGGGKPRDTGPDPVEAPSEKGQWIPYGPNGVLKFIPDPVQEDVSVQDTAGTAVFPNRMKG